MLLLAADAPGGAWIGAQARDRYVLAAGGAFAVAACRDPLISGVQFAQLRHVPRHFGVVEIRDEIGDCLIGQVRHGAGESGVRLVACAGDLSPEVIHQNGPARRDGARELGKLRGIERQGMAPRRYFTTSTGTPLWASTLLVSLPRISREMPRRPCEAMQMRSHLCFFTALTISSNG